MLQICEGLFFILIFESMAVLVLSVQQSNSGVYMHVFVCMCVCVCVCVYLYIHVYIYLCVCVTESLFLHLKLTQLYFKNQTKNTTQPWSICQYEFKISFSDSFPL